MRYTELATHLFVANARAQQQKRAGAQVAGHDRPEGASRRAGSVGYTPTTLILTEMERIDAASNALNQSVTMNVTDVNVRQGWFDWLGRWRAYVEHKQSPLWRYSVVSQLESDSWRDEVNVWGRDLGRWRATYDAQRTPSGTSLPPVPGPGVPDPIPLSPQTDPNAPHHHWYDPLLPWYASLSLPWYVWVLGGVGLVGLGYSGYRVLKRTSDTEKQLRAATEGAIFSRIGGGYAPHASRDHSRDPGAWGASPGIVKEVHYVQAPPPAIASV
jgi:hypothetical protein